MRTTVMTASMAIGLLVVNSGYARDQDPSSDVQNINHTNSGINIADGGRAGGLHSVNGSIVVGDHAIVASATTVNGSVRIGDDSHTEALSTVNGGVGVGRHTVVAGYITSVNGQLKVDDDAVVRGDARNVNSSIVIGQNALVGGKIVTYNGDITLQENARVDGGIRVKDSNHWFSNLFGGFQRRPVITIGPGAQVGGDLVFEHDVELRVHSTAKIGAVTGAKVERY